MFDPPPEYCNRHDPNQTQNKVTPDLLRTFPSVASAYLTLTECGAIEYDIPSCGDFLYLNAHEIEIERKEFAPVRDNPHSVPFARNSGGELWCWTLLRLGAGSEPEIVLVGFNGDFEFYAPRFEGFLYRCALEDACSQPGSERIAAMAQTLRSVMANQLADDLDSVVSRTLPLTQPEFCNRIERFLGRDYLHNKQRKDNC